MEKHEAAPDMTSLMHRLAFADRSVLELKSDLNKLSIVLTDKDKVISDCRKEIESLKSERDRLASDLSNTARELLSIPKSFKSDLTSSPDSAALKELLARRETDLFLLSQRANELETQNAAMRVVVDVQTASHKSIADLCESILLSNSKLIIYFLEKFLEDICLLEEPLLSVLCQTLEDAKLLAYLQEASKTDDLKQTTWKDFSNSWKHIATTLLETLQHTHKIIKLKKN